LAERSASHSSNRSHNKGRARGRNLQPGPKMLWT